MQTNSQDNGTPEKNARLSQQYESYNYISRQILDFKIQYNEKLDSKAHFDLLDSFLIELLYFENNQLFLFYKDGYCESTHNARAFLGKTYKLLAHKLGLRENRKFEAWELPGFTTYNQMDRDYIRESKSLLDDLVSDLQKQMGTNSPYL